MRRTRQWLIPLGLLLLCIWARGYQFNVKDQSIIVPYVQHTIFGVPFSPHDQVIQNIDGVSTVHVFLAPLFRALPGLPRSNAALEWYLFVLYVLTQYIFFAVLLRLAYRITGSTNVAVLGCLMLILFTPRTLVFPTVIADHLGTRGPATAIALLALFLAVKSRPLAACVVSGFAANINPTIALPVMIVAVWSAGSTAGTFRSRLLRIAGGIALSLASASPWLIATASTRMSVGFWRPSQEWQAAFMVRFWFQNARVWGPLPWIELLAPFAIIAATQFRGRDPEGGAIHPERVLVHVCAALILTQVLATLASLNALARMQLTRAHLYLVVFAVMGLARALDSRDDDLPTRGAWVALFLAVAFNLPQVAALLGLAILVTRHAKTPARLVAPCLAVCVSFLFRDTWLHFKIAGYNVTGAGFAALLCLAALALAMALGYRRTWRKRLLPAAIAACVAACVLLPFALWAGARMQFGEYPLRQALWARYSIPGLRRRPPIEQAAVWARANTPEDALFLVPFTAHPFRGYSRRGLLYTWKDGCFAFFDEKYAADWMRKYCLWDLGTSCSAPFGRLQPSDIPAHVSYALLPSFMLPPEEPASRIVYTNTSYLIVHLHGATRAPVSGKEE